MEGKYKGIHLVATFALGVIITAGAFLVQGETAQGKIKMLDIDLGDGTSISQEELKGSIKVKTENNTVIVLPEYSGKVETTEGFETRLKDFFNSEYEGGELTESKDNDEPAGRIEFEPGEVSRNQAAEMITVTLGIGSEGGVATFNYWAGTEEGGKLELTPEARAALACYFDPDCNTEKSQKSQGDIEIEPLDLQNNGNAADSEYTSVEIVGLEEGKGSRILFHYQYQTEAGSKVEFTDEAKAEIACYFSGDCEDKK